ncbi:hypothetical protein HPB50_019036 [Hyalomma asiaticum]|uniref:Uncharacterized protein n=1 Tax=Hyalomma asiaticum TaxID=266040 RepID=A0ACB7TIR6_HYAAI|nr:hypothetical protein HPB50_019036 [Hyalomma asiaticum]
MGEGPEEGPPKIHPRNRNDVADTIAEHVAKLCRKNWLKTCDGLLGMLSARWTWCLMRHLIDLLSSKTATNRNLTKVLNTYKRDGRRLLEDLKAKYLKIREGQYPVPERY